MKPVPTLLLAAAAGFIALVYEILWARIYSFTTASRAVAFGCLLGSYLLGLAIGALFSRHLQKAGSASANYWPVLSRVLIGANLAAFLVVPAISWSVLWTHWSLTFPFVVIAAALLGTFLPLLCHAAIPPSDDVGIRLSHVYLANIIGSGAGSLVAGFALLEHWTLSEITLGLLLTSLTISVFISLRRYRLRPLDCALWATALLLALCTGRLHDGLYERLQLRSAYNPEQRFVNIVESRHGVITVDQDRVIYGSGIYDGMIETDPTRGGGLQRPYFLSAVHEAPRRVLIIGVSGGAWTQILANHPQVEQITAVDIDPGYLRIIAAYPQVSSILDNPKVQIVIDDGRRWLRRNPGQKFDLIVMNTTFHWREFSTSLLSQEFLEQTKRHLNDNGLLLWNCTGSARAIATGMAVFPYTMMISNNCLASTSPLQVNLSRLRDVLSAYRIDGKPVYDLTTETGRQALDDMMAFSNPNHPKTGLQTRGQMKDHYGSAALITDDNLGEEYSFSLKKNLFFKRLTE